MFRRIGIFFGAVITFYAVAGSASPAETQTPAGEVARMMTVAASGGLTKQQTDRFDGCRTKLKAAHRLDVLYALDWKPPHEPYVVAGATFFRVPIDAKEGFADTVNCFLMAGRDSYVNFDILDWRTGKPVGRYSYGRFAMK